MANENPEKASLSPAEMRRAWRIVTWAGLLGSFYYILCITGASRVKFFTELGATATDFGWMAGLGSFALVFQILGSVITNRLTWRRGVWIGIALAHRSVFLCVLVAPFLFPGMEEVRIRILWIIAALFLHDALAQTSVPMWLDWMAELVPKESMNHQWAVRQRFITALNMVAMVLVAIVFYYFEQHDQVVEGFVITAAVGVVLGWIDVLMFFRVPELPNERYENVSLRAALVQPLADSEFRPFLLFMAYFHFAVFISAPFFALFMFDYLKMDVFTVQMLTAASSLGVVVSSSLWGLLCDTYGFRPTLRVLALGKVVTPLFYVLAPPVPAISIPFLAVAMFTDGFLNAGFALATQGVLLKSTPRRNRTMYIAAANFVAMGLMAGLAPLVGGPLIDFLNARIPEVWLGVYLITGYHVVFLGSTFLRYLAYLATARIREARNVDTRVMLEQVLDINTIRVTRLVRLLSESRSEQRRMEAGRALGELRHPLAVRPLIEAMADPSPAVQESATDALGKIGGAVATESLIHAMLSQQNGIRSRAARALGNIPGTESLRALLANFRTRDTEVLVETVDALGRIGDDVAILPMLSLFHDTTDERLRAHILEALSRLGKTDSVSEVMEMLRQRRPIQQRVPR